MQTNLEVVLHHVALKVYCDFVQADVLSDRLVDHSVHVVLVQNHVHAGLQKA